MRYLAVLVIFLALSNVAFAASSSDIGEILFRDILKMTEYPGAPFSGSIVNDLVMFLFIPTAFMIVVVYVLVGRFTPHHSLNLLMSLAFYAFIIFGGYYRIFALLAGPYFLFLLVFFGIILFFLGHFGLRRGGAPAGGAPQTMPGRAVEATAFAAQGEANLTLQLLRGAMTYNGQMDILNKNLKTLETDYKAAKNEHNDRLAQSLQQQVTYLKSLQHYLEQQHRFNPTPGPVPV